MEILPGQLASGKKYKFSVTYHKAELYASRTVSMKILAGRPPVVKIRNQQRVKENPDNKVIVRGDISRINVKKIVIATTRIASIWIGNDTTRMIHQKIRQTKLFIGK